MNLPDLRVFTVVARHDSLHAAAEELHLTPSAISKALKRLEEELGLPLFDRSTRQLVLNERGALLLDRARTLLDLEEQARAPCSKARRWPPWRAANCMRPWSRKRLWTARIGLRGGKRPAWVNWPWT